MWGHPESVGTGQPVYYTRKISWFLQVTTFVPRITTENGKTRPPSELKTLSFESRDCASVAFAALNASLFYWFVTTESDCRNLNMREVLGYPVDLHAFTKNQQGELVKNAGELATDLESKSERRRMRFRNVGELDIQCLFPGRSKAVIDQIDAVLQKHYGFTDEELDLIINYDIKYRTGLSGNGDDE